MGSTTAAAQKTFSWVKIEVAFCADVTPYPHNLSSASLPTMYYERLQVAARTGADKVPVYYARDEDWNPVILKSGLAEKEIQALLEAERIKRLLGLPRTNVRRWGADGIVADCLYDYDYNNSHICQSGIDRGKRLSNIKLKQWSHEVDDRVAVRSFLKALAFRVMIGTDDTVPRNFVLIDQTVYSVDDPAWGVEPARLWKVKTNADRYNRLLDENWNWVLAFLSDWKHTQGLSAFNYAMIDKLSDRTYWVF